MGETGEAFKALNELKQERIAKEQPKRIEYALSQLDRIGMKYKVQEPEIIIKMPKGTITFWAYTGWFCGQKPYGKIKGRGIVNLIKELTNIRDI